MLATDGTTKRCTKCGEDKDRSLFSKDKSRKDGLQRRCQACQAEYRDAHRQELRAYLREKYRADPEAALARNAEYRAANREKLNAQAAARYQAQRDHRVAAAVESYWADPLGKRSQSQRRRARRIGAPVVELVDLAAIWDRDKGVCHLCGNPCDPNDWHLDHLIPLARGGHHTPGNVAVSHPFCNRSRGNRLVEEL